jgi:hypothetical protein
LRRMKPDAIARLLVGPVIVMILIVLEPDQVVS